MKGKFVCFWNNRNARRKQSGTLIFWWKQFLDKVGHDKATLLMHTDINQLRKFDHKHYSHATLELNYDQSVGYGQLGVRSF